VNSLWRAQGKVLRDDRVARMVSLNSEAARLGIQPRTLSEIELGRLDPDHFPDIKRMVLE